MKYIYSTLSLRYYFKRRSRQPYGMAGGGPGATGRNTWIKWQRKEDGDLPEEEVLDPLSPDAKQSSNKIAPREINIGGKATVWMGTGDRLVIETPGGGAWGAADDEKYEGKQEVTTGVKGVVEKVKIMASDAWQARGSLAERAAMQAGF